MGQTVVSISGFSSESGKTSLLCDLLTRSHGWEAIKITRGHYRSCGKDPHSCCVSGLLSDKPLVLSGYAQTYKAGKDTGRFWDSGASNVHWVIATSDQVEAGINTALGRVASTSVLIEGNSFLKYVEADYSIMVACPPFKPIKSSAMSVMERMDALYLSFCEPSKAQVNDLLSNLTHKYPALGDIPIFSSQNQETLLQTIRRVEQTI
jgi:molybdopterin-guanine dinucleotide biosynthesis protein